MASPVKEQLVVYLRTQAGWRAEKAKDYPDARNARSEQRLRALADHVEALPSRDARLRTLQALHEHYGLDVFSPGEEGRRMIAEFGFHGEEDSEAFLDRLVSAEARDSIDREHEGATASDALASPCF